MDVIVSIISGSFRYLVSLPPGDDGGEWLKEMRGNLGLMATVIATMAFQNGLNPPGGVIQNGDNGSVACPSPIAHGQACPGQSVYAAVDRHGYSGFMLTNSISFLFSITTCILVISGVPLGPGYPTLVLAMLILAASMPLGPWLSVEWWFGISNGRANCLAKMVVDAAVVCNSARTEMNPLVSMQDCSWCT
ncbi:hypothetical protein Ahy_B02g057616 [Arachis hypogaea]|uniref:PGG domain-containing protein n=1 Tax=Arachis hypogaea TaxID=3818 RepID=A0A445AC99_ARAHY|nr:hypothetical protein Ahy_B02g057616 [Arachis hypogaea]